MTDDRDQSWRAFADDVEASGFDDEPTPQPPVDTATGKTLSHILQRHERAIDRTIEAIDGVVDELREVAGQPRQEEKGGSAPAFPWGRADWAGPAIADSRQVERIEPAAPGTKAVQEKRSPAPFIEPAGPVPARETRQFAAPNGKAVPDKRWATPFVESARPAPEGENRQFVAPDVKATPAVEVPAAGKPPIAPTIEPVKVASESKAGQFVAPDVKATPAVEVPAAGKPPIAPTIEPVKVASESKAGQFVAPDVKATPAVEVPAADKPPIAPTIEPVKVASESEVRENVAPDAKATPASAVPAADEPPIAPTIEPVKVASESKTGQFATPEAKGTQTVALPAANETQVALAPVEQARHPDKELQLEKESRQSAGPELKTVPAADKPQIPIVPGSATLEREPSLMQPAMAEAKPMTAAEKPRDPTVTGPARPGLRGEPISHAPETRIDAPAAPLRPEMKDVPSLPGKVILEGDTGPVKVKERLPENGGPTGGDNDRGRRGGGGGGGGGGVFHKRLGPVDFGASLKAGLWAVKKNLLVVMLFTIASNVLVLAIPIYLFQISDRVLTSRSTDTLVMLTIVIVGAVIIQTMFDAIRRFILMRTAVEVAAQLGAPILSAAARASLHGNGREYQTLGDLQQLRSFLVSGTLLAFLDAPLAPLFMLAVVLIHPHLGVIVVTSALVLLAVTIINQRATEAPFSEANTHQSKANVHLDSMSRNSQIINALAMIPEAVRIWGKDTANSLRAQVIAQDRNIAFAAFSKAVRLLTQVAMLGWGAHLAIDGQVTGGMVIAASIIAGRALGPIEGAIEGWNQVVQSRAAYGRIASLLQSSPLNFERLNLPRPEGRLDVERLLFVPQGTKRVVLNGIAFSLVPGDSLAIIGNSGAGKTTLGKMLVGSILPTSGNVRLDLMDLRNWDPRQFGENIGYLPQDVQLFPASIKSNIARMRDDATDAEIYEAANLADVHEMIATLPHGYETFVAADGAPLSGGQKQRIALARAFFGNPRLVVLDEPNSNLDAAGDAALGRALQHAKDHKITVVTITQRPALLKSVDKILLLVNGTVALFGMRQDVLQALASRGLSIEGGSFGHQIQ